MINQVGLPGSTRERLVEVARSLFYEKGYRGTSVAEILETAGVNSGSLYHFFDTKQDLLLAVLRSYRDGIDEMLIGPAWEGVEDPIERVFALLGTYRALLAESDYSRGCPIGNLALELHEPDPPVRRLLTENFEAWKRRVEGCFEEAGGRLPPDTSPHTLAAFVLTVMEGAVMQARTYREIRPFDEAVEMLRDLLNRMKAAGQGGCREKEGTIR